MPYKVKSHLGTEHYFASLENAMKYAERMYKKMPHTSSPHDCVHITWDSSARDSGTVWVGDDHDDRDED